MCGRASKDGARPKPQAQHRRSWLSAKVRPNLSREFEIRRQAFDAVEDVVCGVRSVEQLRIIVVDLDVVPDGESPIEAFLVIWCACVPKVIARQALSLTVSRTKSLCRIAKATGIATEEVGERYC